METFPFEWIENINTEAKSRAEVYQFTLFIEIEESEFPCHISNFVSMVRSNRDAMGASFHGERHNFSVLFINDKSIYDFNCALDINCELPFYF